MHPHYAAHIKKSCTDKKAYMTQGLAAVAAHEFMSIRKDVSLMGAYRCKHCGDWHLTKKVLLEASAEFLVIPAEPIITRDRVERRRKERKCMGPIEYERRLRTLLRQPKE